VAGLGAFGLKRRRMPRSNLVQRAGVGALIRGARRD